MRSLTGISKPTMFDCTSLPAVCSRPEWSLAFRPSDNSAPDTLRYSTKRPRNATKCSALRILPGTASTVNQRIVKKATHTSGRNTAKPRGETTTPCTLGRTHLQEPPLTGLGSPEQYPCSYHLELLSGPTRVFGIPR